MQLVRAMIQLLEKGYYLRAIARELHLSRKTVTEYVSRLKDSAHELSELRKLEETALAAIVYLSVPGPLEQEDARKKDFISRIDYFLGKLNRTGVTRLLLWEEYQKENPPEGGYAYTQFCVLLKACRNKVNPVMHFSYQPAEMMMVDFAGDKMHYVDKATGEVIECPVLVCVLPYSGYSFVKALEKATIGEVINALDSCLVFWGGVPHSLKTDNMKQVVIKASRYESLFTEAFQQWALHYDIALLTARVRKPTNT